jgi:low affinity Fe/Cu permease
MENTYRSSNVGLTYGLVTGLIVCIITLVQYLGGINTYLSPIGFVVYLVLIVIAVLAGLKQKKINGGYLEFGHALKVTFSVVASALLLQTLFNYVLLNYIDVPFKQALAQEALNRTEEFMRKFGTSDSKIDEIMDQARQKDSFSFGSMILGYALWCIVWFLVCLIISAIIKKNKPVFPTTQI